MFDAWEAIQVTSRLAVGGNLQQSHHLSPLKPSIDPFAYAGSIFTTKAGFKIQNDVAWPKSWSGTS